MKRKKIPFCPEKKLFLRMKIKKHKKTKPKNYTKAKNLVYDWADNKKYLFHYKLFKFFVTHGMLVDKLHKILSFRQSKWLEMYISFNAQNRNKVGNDFKKTSINYLITNFMEKQWKMFETV